MSIKVGILGASGYTGGELVRLLSRHPAVELALVTSERHAGKPLSTAFPHLRGGGGELICQPMDATEGGDACSLFFCALPHVTSMTMVPKLLEKGARVIDLSADFRLRDPETYRQWYGESHRAPWLLNEAVYGLPELYREEIRSARLVANPGCYPTSIILALAPLLREGAIDLNSLVIDSKSGVSGAGRSAVQNSLYCEVAEGFRAYKVTGHRHTPEIEQCLGLLAKQAVRVRFTPHLLPQSRGILSTCYVRPLQERNEAEWRELFIAHYRQEPMIRVLPSGELPSTAQVRGSNFCDLAVVSDPRSGWLIILSVIDNLVKGAAGQAVQNMNLLLGIDETTGLTQLPLFP